MKEKKKEKKKIGTEPGWATAQLSLELGAGQALGARGWADCAQQALGERACWACQAPAAGGCERAWRAGLACWGAQGSRRTGAGGRARARASGSWAQAQAGGRALGARQAGVGRAAWAGLRQCTRCTRPIFDPF